jgi:hypothetical protein
VPWPLGPPDGRYLLRTPGDPETAPPAHVLVVATLSALERRRLIGRRPKKTEAEPEPDPTPVSTGRGTVIDVGSSFDDEAQATAWLARAGEDELEQDLAVLNRALHSFRLASADPYVTPVGRHQLLVARIGYGAGDEVADGLWTEARTLIAPVRRERRARILAPQVRLAALLGAREPLLACEELTLRARLDLDHGRPREAALQLLVALDATIAELAADAHADSLADRLSELREQRDPVAHAAQAALEGSLSEDHRATVELVLGRVEAALRARAAAKG